MSGMSSDGRSSQGLANALSNVFKLADVNGLKWVRYCGPNSSVLETPKDDPVLNSYARLLKEGYACSWRRLSPSTDGLSGEAKDLWVFFFTDLPDIATQLAEGLNEDCSGSWEDGMSPESSTMLYRALHNIIERSLMVENFLPLGKWFTRPDSSVALDGSSRGCFLCSFSFFVHAHLYICASVDMRAGPSLQPLLPAHISQALTSSTGLQVILSPSGLNAVMTGHSYKASDAGIAEILEEWQQFYPSLQPSPSLPAAIEVILGGVRMRYPSQFVFVYHGEEALSAPPPSCVSEGDMHQVVQSTWDTCHCIDSALLQKESVQCRCHDRGSHRRASNLDLPLRGSVNRRGSRYEPYPSSSTGGKSSSRRATAKELATPGSLNLMNIPVLNAKRKLSRFGLPTYTAPLASPALPPTSTTTLKPPAPSLPLPSISLNTSSEMMLAPTPAFPGFAPKVCSVGYDESRLPNILTKLPNSSLTTPTHPHHGWLDCLNLPESQQSLLDLQMPRSDSLRLRSSAARKETALSSPMMAAGSPSITALLSPTNKKAGSPFKRGKNSPSLSDNVLLPKTLGPTPLAPVGGGGSDQPNPQSKRLASISKSGPTSTGRSTDSGIGSIDRLLPLDDGFGGMESPMSTDGDIGNGATSLDGLDNEGDKSILLKPLPPIDVFSDRVVKIEAGDLDRIFSSDEEDGGHEEDFGFGGGVSQKKTKQRSEPGNKNIKLSAPDLSRIYPTPPSVEALEKFDENKPVGEERTDTSSSSAWDNNSAISQLNYFDSELKCVPMEYEPLSNLSLLDYTPSHVYKPKPTSAKISTSSSESLTSRTSSSSKSEPQRFIFPPPVAGGTRSTAVRDALTLPLTTAHRSHHFSPHLFTPQLLTSSPAYHLASRGGQHHGRFPSSTPLESPFDTVTPTPLSASTNNLMPVLPEANSLYVNIALLDSALGANLSSETLQFQSGPLMSAIDNFMKFSSQRLKLDSTSALDSSLGPLDGGGSSSTSSMLNCQDEKPLMTFGIADYPSLGFREELGMVGGMMGESDWATANPLGALSKFISSVLGDKAPPPSDMESVIAAFPLEKFLELLMDHCVHLCMTSRYDNHTGIQHQLQQDRHLQSTLVSTSSDQFDWKENASSRLYHSHSVVSAIVNAKQLVMSSLRKSGGVVPTATKPTAVTLAKEDNSGAWILDLLTLPTKFMMKRLRELRSVLQNSFHHAPCLKFTTKGPLSLKDLQQLAPSQTALGDDCSPLPIQPVLVGSDHDWLSVSPLSLSSWDKLSFEPYSMRKNVAYVVLTHSSLATSLIPSIKKFFRDLSITFQKCQLGVHLPLEKGVGEDGIMVPPADASSTSDPQTNSRHGLPASVKTFCKKVIMPFLVSLPTSEEELFSSHTPKYADHASFLPSGINQPTPPLSIVLYVMCSSSQEYFQLMHTFSEILTNEEMPSGIRDKVVLQLLDVSDLLGPSSGQCAQLRSLAFSVYSRCRPTLDLLAGVKTLTSFGPTAERLTSPRPPYYQVYAPAFVLSPETPLSSTGLPTGPQTHHILFNPEEGVLFCGYCVSPDQRWLLVVCCDRQGELLDTAVIGIPHSNMDSSRCVALQKLWAYVCSIVAGTVIKWSIVITRFGKPSTSEIRNWPDVIMDDGLLTSNMLLRNGCAACEQTSSHPHLANVLVTSVQPERNIQLFTNLDPSPSLSHVVVLPQDPRMANATCMTPSGAENEANEFEFGGSSDMMGFGFAMGDFMDTIGSALNTIDIIPELPVAAGVEDTTPKATGYLISTSPPGGLPHEFWGHETPQNVCSMFKVLLHCQRSESIADSPQETLGSTLLCFDALSWLTVDHRTSQRRSCLPLHLFILSKLYHIVKELNSKAR